MGFLIQDLILSLQCHTVPNFIVAMSIVVVLTWGLSIIS